MAEHSNISDDTRGVEDRHPAELSLLTLSSEELNDLIDYMSDSYDGTYLDLLYSIIGSDKILLYLETLEGMTVRIPNKKTLVKIVFYIRVYNYLKSRSFSEEAYKKASKIYGKRVFDLKRIAKKVETVLERHNEKV